MNARYYCGLFGALLLMVSSGCTSLLFPIEGIPVRCVPQHCLAVPRADYQNVPFTMLRMTRPDEYVIDSGDILGVYIDSVLPPRGVDNPIMSAPIVNFPEEGSDLPPSIGYPIVVRDDGTMPIPLIDPVDVSGLTIRQVEDKIREIFIEKEKILLPKQARIMVSVMRERTRRVVVIREDGDTNSGQGGGELIQGTTRRGSGYTLDMPIYKNDLMHALADTGGLPGLNAKNQVTIYRASDHRQVAFQDVPMPTLIEQDTVLIETSNGLDLGDTTYVGETVIVDGDTIQPGRLTIPLRAPPGHVPAINPKDIVLEDGDIVYVESRDTEFFYTGGLLPSGQFPLPRDYDLDVLGAMSIAGAGVDGSQAQNGSQGFLGTGFQGATPTQLFIKRNAPHCRQLTIEVDLKLALTDPRENILIMPGDTLILRFKPREEALNFGIATFFTFGIRQLFQ